jgi:hypothetical protein
MVKLNYINTRTHQCIYLIQIIVKLNKNVFKRSISRYIDYH